jgi:hypothetical protein
MIAVDPEVYAEVRAEAEQHAAVNRRDAWNKLDETARDKAVREAIVARGNIAEQVRRSGLLPSGAPTLPVLSWDTLMAEPPIPPPVIRPGIPRVGVCVVAGSPKVGKTLWVSQVALESRRPSLMVIEEGSRDAIADRLRLQAANLGVENPPLSLLHRHRLRLDNRADVRRIAEFVQATRPEIVVLDPLNRLHSADENRPTQMTPVMDALAELAYDGGCAVIAIHHLAKPSAERRGDIWDRFRGASSIRSGTDANLALDGHLDHVKLVGEFRDAQPLVEHMRLDRESLLFVPEDAPTLPAKVDPIALRAFVGERGQVTASQVVEHFAVAKHTALTALRALGCDEFEGPRRTLTFSLGTVQ